MMKRAIPFSVLFVAGAGLAFSAGPSLSLTLPVATDVAAQAPLVIPVYGHGGDAEEDKDRVEDCEAAGHKDCDDEH